MIIRNVKQGRLIAFLLSLHLAVSFALSQSLDVSGWSIEQANSAVTVTLPPGTIIPPGGYLIVARNPASKSAFESFWGVTLPSNVIYLNGTTLVGGSGFPVINGSEVYTLKDGSSNIVDGPTIAMAAAALQSIQRIAPGDPAGSTSSWNILASPNTTATPGSGAGPTSTAGLVINEFSDATGTGNFIYEFVELYYDVAPPPTGKGTASAIPTMVKGNVPDTISVLVRSVGSTILSYVDVVVPSNWSWSHSTSDVSTTGGGTPAIAISGDTVKLSGATVTTSDSIAIDIRSLTPPDSTILYPFHVLTASHPDSILPILTQPTVLVIGAPTPIADIKVNDVNGVPLLLGKYVTVRGIVTVANEFGSPSYIQDNTAGIGFYDVPLSSSLNRGDEIVLTGTIAPFNGLCELSNLMLQEIVSTGNSIDPVVVTTAQIKNDGAGGVEQYEGLLVRVNAATVTDTFNVQITNWTVSGSGTNYRLHDASGFVEIRVDNSVNYANAPAPQTAFDVIGVVGQFKAASPYIGGYQFMPRSTADILSKGPMIATPPYESDITSSSLKINWTTTDSGTSRLRYGTTTGYELGVIAPDDLLRKTHAVDISGLTAATIYHVQAFSVRDPDTSTAGDLIVSTASPAQTSGQINVYFNKTVNTSVAIFQNANGNQNLVSRLSTRIANASHSIDACFYSLSGTGEGSVIASALASAKARGVNVRVICEADNRNTSAFNSIAAAGIPIITDAYDLTWAGQGLSHNKFVVVDYAGGAPDSVWVWTGSWNPTSPGTNDDRQNSIEIQDVALAGAYTTEFNEMWGSSTLTPNQSLTRFGARKRDNTPHRFNIKGVEVESFFSPSDHTTSHIASTLHKAQHSASVGVLTFTRKDLADTLIARKNAGKKVRVVLDNNTDTGNQFAYLESNGVDIHLKGGGAGFLHHKYATVDGDQLGGPQYTITGSHNWSNSAEGSNDENTLIIENDRVANQYLQEFAARYYEAGGTDSIHVASAPIFIVTPASIDFGSIDTMTTKHDSVTVSNSGNAPLTVSAATSTNVVFAVTPDSATIDPLSSKKFYVSFAPVDSGMRTGFIIFTHNAPGSPDSVFVKGTGRIDTVVTPPPVSDSVKVMYHILAGWNMLSVPVTVDDTRKTSLFPAASSKAFAYNGIYVAKDTLVKGEGYWLKFGSARTDSISGRKFDAESTAVKSGWNIIGPPSKPVPISSIVQSPPSNAVSNYYGYNGAYFAEDTLIPGKAYWIKTRLAGSLYLYGTRAVPKIQAIDELSEMNVLTFTDGRGLSQRLHFGNPAGAIALERYEAPPMPPEEGFDVRFRSGRTVEIALKEEQKSSEYGIDLKTPNFPIKLSWSIATKDNNYYHLAIVDAQGSSRIPMTGSGEMTLRGETEKLSLRVDAEKEIPTAFSLGQNYPNPFNPRTMIPFSLPDASTVTLKVYDILGEVVATLIDHQEYDSGNFESAFDASHLATGVYVYRLSAVSHGTAGTSFQQEKKLLLVK